MLSPKGAGSTSGFMGVATIPGGERITEHYHPYSEEFVYCVRGELDAQLEGESNRLKAGEALFIPINMRHRLVNDGDPVLRSHLLAAVAQLTERGQRISKRKSRAHIDACMALAYAAELASTRDDLEVPWLELNRQRLAERQRSEAAPEQMVW